MPSTCKGESTTAEAGSSLESADTAAQDCDNVVLGRDKGSQFLDTVVPRVDLRA